MDKLFFHNSKLWITIIVLRLFKMATNQNVPSLNRGLSLNPRWLRTANHMICKINSSKTNKYITIETEGSDNWEFLEGSKLLEAQVAIVSWCAHPLYWKILHYQYKLSLGGILLKAASTFSPKRGEVWGLLPSVWGTYEGKYCWDMSNFCSHFSEACFPWDTQC